MKDEPGPAVQPSQSPLTFEKVAGHVIVVEQRQQPDIPEGKGRVCPQCHRVAWKQSRFCWHCDYDFDRAAIPRWHPKKLLLVAVFINLIVLVVVLTCAHNGMHGRKPTPVGSGSSPTSVLALAGTLHGITTRDSAMTEQRKIDMAKVWQGVPSSDLLETKQSLRARAAAAPLVNVGHVQGNVITINGTGGIDLAQLLAQPDHQRDDPT